MNLPQLTRSGQETVREEYKEATVQEHPEQTSSREKAQPQTEQSAYSEAVRNEWIEGSGIRSTLFEINVTVVSDLKLENGEVTGTPIHNFLGWKYTRFGHQAQRNNEAALLYGLDALNNWDAPCRFQAKLKHPRQSKDGKPIKYETPKKGDDGDNLPVSHICYSQVDELVWQQLAERYGVNIPKNGARGSAQFWQCIQRKPHIPIVIVEGQKKALALLSRGVVAVALGGVTMWGSRSDGLRDELQAILPKVGNSKRKVIVLFDSDRKRETRKAVDRQARNLAWAVKRQGYQAHICFPPLPDGVTKIGADDYLVNGGDVTQLLLSAQPIESVSNQRAWKARNKSRPTGHVTEINARYLSDSPALQDMRDRLLALDSPMGTGKTQWVAQTLRPETSKLLCITPRRSLNKSVSERLGIDYETDCTWHNGALRTPEGRVTQTFALCPDSLWKLNPRDFVGATVLIDEVGQVLNHLLCGKTCKDRREPIVATLAELLEVAAKVVVAEANLPIRALHYLESLVGNGERFHLVRNRFTPDPFPCSLSEKKTNLEVSLTSDIENGESIRATFDCKAECDAQAAKYRQLYGDKVEIVSITSENSSEWADWLANINSQPFEKQTLLFHSPSISSGLSIDNGQFQKVYGFFTGAHQDARDIAQALGRDRVPVPRHIYVAKKAQTDSHIDATNKDRVWQVLKAREDMSSAQICNVLNYGKSYSQTFERTPANDYYCSLLADKNFSLRNLRDTVIAQLEMSGVPVEMVRDSASAEQVTREKQLSKDARALVKAERAQAVADAPEERLADGEFFDEHYRRLRDKAERTRDENQQLEKYDIANHYLEDVTPELVEKDNNGETRRKHKTFVRLLLTAPEQLAELDAQHNEYATLLLSDRQHTHLERSAWDKVDSLVPGGLLELDSEYTNERLAPLQAAALAAPEQFKSVFGIKPSQTQGGQWLWGQLLKRMGIETALTGQPRRPSGKRERVYSISKDSVQAVVTVLARQAHRYKWEGAKLEKLNQWRTRLGVPEVAHPLRVLSIGTPKNKQGGGVPARGQSLQGLQPFQGVQTGLPGADLEGGVPAQIGGGVPDLLADACESLAEMFSGVVIPPDCTTTTPPERVGTLANPCADEWWHPQPGDEAELVENDGHPQQGFIVDDVSGDGYIRLSYLEPTGELKTSWFPEHQVSVLKEDPVEALL